MVGCPSRKSVVTGTIAFALAFLPMQFSLADEAATPPTSEATTTTKGMASQTLFPANSDEISTRAGEPSGWSPISIRYYDGGEGLAVFVEIRNDTGEDQLTPRLYADLSLEGTSYGQEPVDPMNYWTPAGESAFYESPSFYEGSLTIGDWDAENWFVVPDSYNDPAIQDTTRISVADGRITNETDSVIGQVSFASIVRDGEGVFVGGCIGPWTGANIPPGKSVRIQGLGSMPSCPTLSDGMASSAELGVSEDFSIVSIVASISEP